MPNGNIGAVVVFFFVSSKNFELGEHVIPGNIYCEKIGCQHIGVFSESDSIGQEFQFGDFLLPRKKMTFDS